MSNKKNDNGSNLATNDNDDKNDENTALSFQFPNPKFKNGEIVLAKDINAEFFYPAQIIAYVQGGTYLVNFLREY